MTNKPIPISIEINISQQTLTLFKFGEAWLCYRVSTALNGAGEQNNSGCTPRGLHIIRAMIGRDEALNSVFVGRRPTGEIYSTKLSSEFPKRDWILSRIIWLSGCELGINRLGNVDTMRRYIYIHGTPEIEPMGIPLSHGCVRMKNHDVIDLFDRIDSGVYVTVIDGLFDD